MIAMLISWYDRKSDTYEPDYCRPHSYEIDGETPEICMKKYYILRDSLNLVKHTIPTIASIRTK